MHTIKHLTKHSTISFPFSLTISQKDNISQYSLAFSSPFCFLLDKLDLCLAYPSDERSCLINKLYLSIGFFCFKLRITK